MSATPALPALDKLDTETLERLHSEAADILSARCESELPAAILDVIREALADGDTRTPLRAVFSTTEWDDGYFWYPDEARVTLFDGRTEEIESLDLSGADEVLVDHASYQTEPLGSLDHLIVTFDPPTVRMS